MVRRQKRHRQIHQRGRGRQDVIKKKYYQSAISSIKIERSEGKIVIFIYTGRPGTLIGKQGAGIEQMKAEVQKLVGDKFVVINIMEVKNPDMDAQLVAET